MRLPPTAVEAAEKGQKDLLCATQRRCVINE
jgi:hypothetical protein